MTRASSFNIEIVYDASNDNTTTVIGVSRMPAAASRFSCAFPPRRTIPSTNSVKVTFDTQAGSGGPVSTTVTHEVPEGIINLSETSGGPGSRVTVSGEGFKSFVPISLVKIGYAGRDPGAQAPRPTATA